MKIWHQSLTSIEEVIPYRDAVLKHIDRVARPGVEVVLHGMSEDTYPTHYPGILLLIPICKIFTGSNLSVPL